MGIRITQTSTGIYGDSDEEKKKEKSSGGIRITQKSTGIYGDSRDGKTVVPAQKTEVPARQAEGESTLRLPTAGEYLLTPEAQARFMQAHGVNPGLNAYQQYMIAQANAAPAPEETRSTDELRRDMNRKNVIARGTELMAGQAGQGIQNRMYDPVETTKLRALGGEMERANEEAQAATALYQTVAAERWSQKEREKYASLLENPDFAAKSQGDNEVADRVLLAASPSREAVTYWDIFHRNDPKEDAKSGNAARFVNDEEAAVFFYLWNTQGAKAANTYYRDYVENRASERKANAVQAQAARYGAYDPVGASIASVGTNFVSGVGLIDIALQNLTRAVGLTDRDKPINYNSDFQMPALITDSLRQGVSQHLEELFPEAKIGNSVNVASFLYQTGMSMADSSVAIALNLMGVPEALTLANMGAAAGTRAIRDARERGASDGQALAFGMSSAVMEALFEKISLESVLRASNAHNLAQSIFSALKQGFTEGSEEVMTTVANTVADQIVLGDKSELFNRQRELMEQGVSEKEALGAAFKQWGTEILGDAIGGFLSGAGLGGSKETANARNGLWQWNMPMETARALNALEENGGRTAPGLTPEQRAQAEQAIQERNERDAAKDRLQMRELAEAQAARAAQTQRTAPALNETGQGNTETAPQGAEAQRGAEEATAGGGLSLPTEETAGREVEPAAPGLPTAGEETPGSGRKTSADRKKQGRLAQQRQRAMADAEAENLRERGFQSAGENSLVYVREENQWDADERAVGTSLREQGIEPTFVTGLLEDQDGKKVGFLQEGNRLALQADDRTQTLRELAEKALGRSLGIGPEGFREAYESVERAREKPLQLPKKPESQRAQAVRESAENAGASREDTDSAVRLAELLGRDIRFYNDPQQRGSWVNGYTQGGVIYVNTGVQKKPVVWVVAHELTHNVENSRAYQSLRGMAKQAYGDRWAGMVKSRVKNAERAAADLGLREVRLTEDGAERELVADFFASELLTDENRIRDVVNHDATMARRIVTCLKNLLNKLKGKEPTLEWAIDRYNAALKETAQGAQTKGENRGRKFSTEKKSTGGEAETTYMNAVERGDMETAQRMVDEAANAAGYTVHVYHGTREFGFTVFDTGKLNDGISLFATSSRQTAETYSGKTTRGRVKDRSLLNADDLRGEELIAEARKHIKWYNDYRLMSEKDKQKIQEEARASINWSIEKAKGFVRDNEGAFNADKAAIMDRLISALYNLRDAETEDQIKAEWEKWEGALFDLRWTDDSITSEFLEAVNSNGVFQSKNELHDMTYPGDMYTDGYFGGPDYIFDKQLQIELNAELNKGIYDLYGKPGKQLVINTTGENWNQITPPEELMLYGPQTTREIASAAKASGYDSVLLKDLRDNGGETLYNGLSDVYIFFDANALKSADPVTYDNEGNVIPLSERFNPEEYDIRYSAETEAVEEYTLDGENRGRKFSAEKMKNRTAKGEDKSKSTGGEAETTYMNAVERGDMETAQRMVDEAANAAMPKSKLRTADDKLRRVYHGTNSGEFYVFDGSLTGAGSGDRGFFGEGFYFAYTSGKAGYFGRRIMDAYLNLENPFDFQKELETLDGKRSHDYNGGRAVFIVNFAQKLPELAKTQSVHVVTKGGESKWISFDKFAQDFLDVYDNVKFKTEKMPGGYGDEWLVTAGKHQESFTDENGQTHTWDEYDYESRAYDKMSAEDRAAHAYSYLLKTKYSQIKLPSSAEVVMDTEFSKALMDRKYDGVIQSEEGDEAVAFRPEQIKSADPVTYDDDGNVIPLSERFNPEEYDIRYSAETEAVEEYTLDGENRGRKFSTEKKSTGGEAETTYMNAVERGDMETAQRMVDEAAKAAGYTVKAYHGTSNAGFNVFDREFSRFGLFGNGFYFTENPEVAQSYTKKGKGTSPGVYSTFLHITNPIDMDAPADLEKWKRAFKEADYDVSYLEDAATNEDAFKALKEYLADEEYVRWEAEEAIEETIRGMGFDGITHRGGGRYGTKDGPRHQVYIVFDSEQIKSADPVTYDKDGNVIHLSERFNADKEDIRYSAESEEDEDIALSGRRILETPALKKIGVKVSGSVGKYSNTAQLKSLSDAANSLKNAAKAAERRLKPTEAERDFASGIAALLYDEEDIPTRLNKEKVLELADYYWAADSANLDALHRVRADINSGLREQAGELLKDAEFHPMSMIMMNERTPERIFRKMFGERGDAIADWMITPVRENEAEKIRWYNRQMDAVREFKDSKGKLRELTREESALTMKLMEGQAAAMTIANMEADPKNRDGKETAKHIRNAAENIRNGEAPGDSAREFSLSDRERDLASQYAQWMTTKEELEKADHVIVEAAAKKYAEIFDNFYDAINDFLVAHGYEPIGYIRGYAPHMQPQENKSLLEKAFEALGINTEVTALPASIAGQTAFFKPNKRWNPYFLQRTGDTAEYDIVKAYQSYVDYLADILYHTDDIMRIRQAVRWIRQTYAPEEIREQLDWAQELQNAPAEDKLRLLKDADEVGQTTVLSPADTAQKMQEYIEKLYAKIGETAKYGNLVMWMENYANILAGKQSYADRGWEYSAGRKSLNWANKLNKAFQRSNVAGNLSSVLNQVAQLPMIRAELGERDYIRALFDVVTGRVRQGNFLQDSDFLAAKAGKEMLFTENADKFINALFAPANAADSLVSTLAVRGAFNKAIRQGASYEEAVRRADAFGQAVMGSRAKGSRPLAYESKGFFSRMIHMFQVEAVNSWDHIISDVPREIRRIAATEGKNKAARALGALILRALLGAFWLNRITDELYGGTPAPFDILGLAATFTASGKGMSTNRYLATVTDNVLEKLGADRLLGTEHMTKEDFDLERASSELIYNVMNDVPLARNLAGVIGLGDQTVPLPGASGEFSDIVKAVHNLLKDGVEPGEVENLLRASFKLGTQFIPGGRQLNKTAQGLEAVLRGGSYSGYGEKEKVQYPITGWADTTRALLFGKSATNAADEFWASGKKALTEKQTSLYKTMAAAGMGRKEAYEAIQKYREINSDDNLSSYEKGKAQRELISGLDTRDEYKLEMYKELSNADSRTESFRAIMETGLSFADCMKIYDKYAEIDQNKDKMAGEKTEDFYLWVDRQSYSKKQREAIKERFKYYSHIPAEASRYEKLTGEGLDPETAYNLEQKLSVLEPEKGKTGVSDTQKWEKAVETVNGTKNQDKALRALMSEEQTKKYNAVRETGVTPEVYVRYKIDTKDLTADKDEKGNSVPGSLKAKVVAYIDSLDLSPTQKSALLTDYNSTYSQADVTWHSGGWGSSGSDWGNSGGNGWGSSEPTLRLPTVEDYEDAPVPMLRLPTV